MKLYLVRHAQSIANTTHVIACEMPGSHLSEPGREQAGALVEKLASRGIEAIYHSRMVRTAETATPLAEELGYDMTELPGFHEVQLGDLAERNDSEAHTTLDETAERWNIDDALGHARPGGESGQQVVDRMWADLDEIRRLHGESERGVVAVAHGLCLRTVTQRWADGVSHEFAFHNLLPNTGVIEIDVPADPAQRPKIVDWVGLGTG